ncbi:hypothetical protein CQS04_04555 [Chryseomicrobium excrementi]|uniref:Uncharacterized protein n=1 Tax=Chryseomicrobium excrementi TaxID=2041346 RepID=A0A2M9F3V4_9BACL|nr:hypothetical protein CQS04_04555 [Chryseomicrobium excrementi]
MGKDFLERRRWWKPDWCRFYAGLDASASSADVKSISASVNVPSADDAPRNERGLDVNAPTADVKSISASVNVPSADDAPSNERGLDAKASSADAKSISASVNAPSADDSHQSSNCWPHFINHRKSFP